MEDLVLPVPETLPALYVVPYAGQDQDLVRLTKDAVAAHVAEPLRSLATQVLGTEILAMTIQPAGAFHVLPPTACDSAVSSEQVQVVTEARKFVAFGSLLRPLPGPLHEWLARAAAASFAAECDLPLVDGYTRTIMTADSLLGTLPGSPALAEADGGFCLPDWVAVRVCDDGLVTSGLGRFGLPELRVTDVPPDHYLAWGLALVGLGQRLHSVLRCDLRRFAEVAFVQAPAELMVMPADLGGAQALPFSSDAGLKVRLVLDPAVGDTLRSYLTVEAPADWTGTPAEHRMALRDLLVAEVQSYLQDFQPT